jgi:integrase
MKGSIRQRGETFTAYWFTADPGTGERVQHSKGGFAHGEPGRPAKGDSAREFLNSIIGVVQAGDWHKETALTVRQLFDGHYLPTRRSEGLRPSTLDQYSNVIDAWILPYLGGLQVRKLTPKVVGDWISTLQTTGSRADKPLSPRSVQLSVTILKSATRWAFENGHIARDPLGAVRRPRGGASRATTAWSPEQAMMFLQSVSTDRLRAAWWLFLSRGPRRGELVGLKWKAVDLARGTLRVIETRIVVDGHAQTSTPKTDSGRRTIPLDAHLVALLKAHKAAQREERAVVAIGDPGYVFTNEVGEPYNPDWISRRFVELASAAGLPALTIHGTRHTAASIMLSSGIDAAAVAAILGHSSPVITLSIYRHLFEGETARAGELMSRVLRGDLEATR